MSNKPNRFDLFLLSCFTIFITFQPYYLHGEIIMMETGIHLPAINALFHGAVPYRDVFFLRGPFELYVPAFLMALFGKNMAILPTFYYVGTAATLLVFLAIAQNLYRTRLILYLMIVVFVARTFPRISFNYWGGMRYALGALALLCVLFFFQKEKQRWIFWAGVVSALAFLTTIEAGFAAICSVGAGIIFAWIFKMKPRPFLAKALGIYGLGIFIVLFPYFVYLVATQSLIPLIESTWVVVTRMMEAFPNGQPKYPVTITEFFVSMLPGGPYFKILTPIYCYLAFAFYLAVRIRQKKIDGQIVALVSLAMYSLILYIAAFRKIEGHHFEMALQPEKIILFFLLEEVFLNLKQYTTFRHPDPERSEGEGSQSFGILPPQKFCGVRMTAGKLWTNLLVAGLVLSSVGYAISRYNHRFIMFRWLTGQSTEKLQPLAKEKTRELNLERGKGMVVPQWQADELEWGVRFIQDHTQPDDVLFAYPEIGNFNFLADRPFVGRFPVVSFSWMDEKWLESTIEALIANKPKYVIMTNVGHRTFPSEWYFRSPRTKAYYYETVDWILREYKFIKAFESISVYQLKEENLSNSQTTPR